MDNQDQNQQGGGVNQVSSVGQTQQPSAPYPMQQAPAAEQVQQTPNPISPAAEVPTSMPAEPTPATEVPLSGQMPAGEVAASAPASSVPPMGQMEQQGQMSSVPQQPPVGTPEEEGTNQGPLQ